MHKRIVSLLMTVLMLAAMVPTTVWGVSIVDSGTCGIDATWSLASNGTLTIIGTGDIVDYHSTDDAPWMTYRNEIKHLVISDGITGIGNWAFALCTMEDISIPDSVSRIGTGAFFYSKDFSNITIPGSVKVIGDQAFMNCEKLSNLTLSSGLQNIGKQAFWACRNLKSVTIPNSVTTLGDSAFNHCTSLSYAKLSNRLKVVSAFAFNDCSSLVTIIIPHGITDIKEYAFTDAILSSITSPQSVISIGNSAFWRCYSLADVYYAGTAADWGKIAIADNNKKLTNATIHYAGLGVPTMTLTNASNGKPTISWTKVDGAAQYEVYRSDTGKVDSYKIIRRTAVLTYTDTTAAAGKTYYYMVRSINGSTTGKFCAARPIAVPGALGVPTMTLTTASNGNPVIKWTKVNGAAQYEVYRSDTGKANTFRIIRRTAGLTYTDTSTAAGKTYYYVVRAINGSNAGKFCAAKSVAVALGVPTMTLTTASNGNPVIKWTKVNGAAQYEVYRSDTGKPNTFRIIRRTAGLTYTDTAAAADKTYYYVVRAINDSTAGKFCAAKSIKCTTTLSVPFMLFLTNASSGKPVISWTKVNGASQYEIYRSTDGRNYSIIRRTGALSYTDTAAVVGMTYYYKVRAMSGSVYGRFCTPQLIRCEAAAARIGFITLHDENSGYDLNFINAAKETIAALGLTDTDYILKTNVPEGQECYDVAVDMAKKGCRIIFANSYGHQSYMLQAAREYPDVQFCVASGILAHTSNLSNYHDAYAAIYEGRYLTGVAAGMKLNEMIAAGKFTADEAVVGYVGTFPYAEVVSAYTAFFLGIRSVCPTATMNVTFTGSWYDEVLERESADYLINGRGCKLISQYSDSRGAPIFCEKAGIPNVSYNGSAKATAPNAYLVSTRINWAPYYEYAIDAALNGRAISTDWTGTLATGSVVVEDLNTRVAASGTAEVLADVAAKLENGTVQVFDCNTFTVNGKKVTSYYADVDYDDDYTPDTQVIRNGCFAESAFRSAPYFDLAIDGITLLNTL